MRRLILLSIAGSLIYVAYTQQRDWAVEKLERSLAAEKKSDLNSPYRGVTASGTVEPGLFRIQSTGVSTAPVRKAAESLLKALSAEQRKKTQFPVDDIEWRKWMNQDFYVRQGMGFAEMTEPQREAAFGIFKAALSAKGLQLSRDIMKLNETLGEMTGNLPR